MTIRFHADFDPLDSDVTLLFGLYAVMVNDCSGVRSNETGSVRTSATCMPFMMLMALMILYGCCVLFSESSDLPQLSEVVLMAPHHGGFDCARLDV
jgi:hypothetical protein